MSKKSVSCLATCREQADRIVARLKAESFSDSQIVVGTAMGGIANGLVGLGVHQSETERYEGKVKAGHVLISVHTDDVGDIARPRDMFRQSGAQDIGAADEAATSKKHPATERGSRPFEISPA